jgi:hypothetical protein
VTTVAWPSDRAFGSRACRVGAFTAKSRFAGFFDGHVESLSHSATRLLLTLTLPACAPLDAARREAFFLNLASSGDWVTLGHPHRREPTGTMRGTPNVSVAGLAGARTLRVQGVPGDTLVAGDVIGVSGHMLITAYAGCVADGGGLLIVPLALPLPAAISVSQAVAWQAPTGAFQLMTDTTELGYGRGAWQQPLDLTFGQVY